MPNSLKCRLKGLVRKGLLSEKDLSRIYTDNDVVEELEKIKAIYIKLSDENVKEHSKSDYYIGKTTAYAVAISTIDERIEKLRGE